MNVEYIKNVETSDTREWNKLLREEFIPAMTSKGLAEWINENKRELFSKPKSGDGFCCYPEIAVTFV